MARLSLLLLPLFFKALQSQALPLTEPGVKSLKVYCKTLLLNDGQCVDKFIGAKNGGLPSGLVGLSAASKCIDKLNLNEVSALEDMFNVDMTKMQNMASGMNTKKPDLDYHQQHDGQISRRVYTEEQKMRAAEYHQAAIEHLNSFAWDLAMASFTFLTAAEPPLAFGAAVSLMVAKKFQSDLAYYTGWNEPWRAGEQPEANCIKGKPTCMTDSGIEIPNPDYTGSDNGGSKNAGSNNGGSNNGGSKNAGNNNGGSDNGGSKNAGSNNGASNNGGSNNEANEQDSESGGASDSPFKDTMEDNDFDAIPDVEETPVPFDETTQTALQKCQEEEERIIWSQIGSTQQDPQSSQKEEEKKSHAEFLLSIGACDKYFYGAEFCQNWKNKQASTPVSEESQQIMNEYKKNLVICPVNLITKMDCEMTKQELWKHYAVKDEFEGPINDLLSPQPPAETVPQLVTGFEFGNIVGISPRHGITGGILSIKPDVKPPHVRSLIPAAARPFNLDAWNHSKNPKLASHVPQRAVRFMSYYTSYFSATSTALARASWVAIGDGARWLTRCWKCCNMEA